MINDILPKIANFCAYQERCLLEVNEKLTNLEVNDDDKLLIVNWLIENNYLNEERFAEIFSGSKFRQLNWGKAKIKYALSQKKIHADLIQKCLNKIDDTDYRNVIEKLIEKKFKELKDINLYTKKGKVLSFLLSKGFVFDDVKQSLDLHFKNNNT